MLLANKKRSALLKKIWNYKYLYLFILPAVVWYTVFCYVPMYGVTLGFKEFRYDKGILGSPWVGLRYVTQFFNYYDFWKLIRNTVLSSGLKLIFCFPAPIILALLLNELKNIRFKKTIQTVSYLPFFISWVIVMTLFNKLFSPNNGPANDLMVSLFGGKPIYFLGEPKLFYPLVVLTDMWKGVGYGSILFLSALSGIDPQLYEAAMVDGCNKWKSIIHISLPGLIPTIGIMFILSIGTLMKGAFEQIYLMQTPSTLDVSEILDTYILKSGIIGGMYSYATVVGIFQSIVSIVLIITTNKISKKVTEVSLW